MRRPGFPAPENSGVAARRIIGQAHQGAQNHARTRSALWRFCRTGLANNLVSTAYKKCEILNSLKI
jgi:hypothetical protein